ncbi:ninja-family protein 1-like [Tripterygium wilfordii]|uniref:Ninja-family protein n=1 Tax=Tripterygium wilfordii TaxID=458696 RepID=A0A7J7DIU9_TRIWF|nr:ninja-family protein AFP3-like [Tripterygium wilfordii]KAF5746290.1 ninja-family protein 1-like [Tripterygium wilfordii]
MERNCAMVTNTITVALKEEEIELELGLSIGGGYERPENLKPIKKEPVQDQQTSNSNSDGSESDPREKNYHHQRSTVSPCFIRDAEQEIDLQVKREIQAARRQEAKKKREEKQQKKRMCKGQNGDNLNEFGIRERQGKRNKVADAVAGSGSNDDELINVNGELTNPMAYIASPMCTVMPMQNQLPPLQLVPVTNGFACMMPCWAQNGAGVVGSERNVIQPVANRIAEPVQATSESVLSLSMCSSSTVSEDHSSSPQEQGRLDRKNDTAERAEDGESISKSTNHIDQPASNAIESSRNLVSTPATNTFRETKGKPPKPVNSNPNTTTLLPHMPRVSTTGNGPNGKTVNGFLYRYTKSEVSIVCVCHGTTFSPAEFVEHAGGTDLSQPLRHITVIPSAL